MAEQMNTLGKLLHDEINKSPKMAEQMNTLVNLLLDEINKSPETAEQTNTRKKLYIPSLESTIPLPPPSPHDLMMMMELNDIRSKLNLLRDCC